MSDAKIQSGEGEGEEYAPPSFKEVDDLCRELDGKASIIRGVGFPSKARNAEGVEQTAEESVAEDFEKACAMLARLAHELWGKP